MFQFVNTPGKGNKHVYIGYEYIHVTHILKLFLWYLE